MESTRPWIAVYKELGLSWDRVPEVPAKTLSHYVREHAGQFREREALVFAGCGMSYETLDQQADRLAHALQSLGLMKGDVLGVHLPNVPQYVVAFVAAARLGVKLTSLSPLLRPAELGYQMDDAQVGVLLTFAPLLAQTGQACVGRSSLRAVIVTGPMDMLEGGSGSCLETLEVPGVVTAHTFQELMAAQPNTAVPDAALVSDVLYLQYTGGTTGKPKGAELSSYNLFCNNVQVDLFYGYRVGGETVASAFPYFHIGGAAVLFNGLRTASTNIVVPDPRDMAAMIGEMARRPPTVLAAVPALFQMLVAQDEFRALNFDGLRIAISGAAPFTEAAIAELEQVVGQGRFWEVYGMTETSPVQTINPSSRIKFGFVGIPVPGTDLRIVDVETGTQVMPTGEPGEVIVSGPQVMRGYANRPEETAAALREHDGKLWMHTGDIGFLDAEGYLRICDRKKDMVIVGGYKVFSAEVENKVAGLPGVGMCAVVGRADAERPGNEVVCLFVQKAPDAPEDAELEAQILAFCRDNMAPYKVPKEVSFVDGLPLTSVGKVDKLQLRERV